MPEIDIRHMEQGIANMLPAQETVFDDGWLLRFNTGKSLNRNSVWPLTAAAESLESRIESCERAYAERDLPCNFRLTALDKDKAIESYLVDRGYKAEIPMLIVVRPITTEPAEDGLTEIDLDGWVDLVQRLDPEADAQDLQEKQAALSSIALPVWYTTIRHDGRECSYGRAVQQDDLYQLCELFTVSDLRGQGLGTQLIRGLLHIGQEAGARTAFMQGVSLSNDGARRLYERFGFQDSYRFHYLTHPDPIYVYFLGSNAWVWIAQKPGAPKDR